MDTKLRKTAGGILIALILGLTGVPQVMAQERTGQVTGVHSEARVIAIDGREYFIPSDANLGFAHDAPDIVSIERLPGANVSYSLRPAGRDEQRPHINRLTVLD